MLQSGSRLGSLARRLSQLQAGMKVAPVSYQSFFRELFSKKVQLFDKKSDVPILPRPEIARNTRNNAYYVLQLSKRRKDILFHIECLREDIKNNARGILAIHKYDWETYQKLLDNMPFRISTFTRFTYDEHAWKKVLESYEEELKFIKSKILKLQE